ncbi:hypothetical protein ZOSMA_72G00730 [Zostera marina]|uniref:Protein kinase domain-containing protein n=1 Tax=Zostera marina TaxID=29655 RepID=A0A0K9NS56_ZOSMR|nr:hypothetical protein ZOSMA_72G00730 [Zostera marina]
MKSQRIGTKVLNWNQRFEIVKGVAAGLLYLHEEGVQVVVHRDIKAANVLLDGDLKNKLSDFGLARLYDHGGNSRTTSVVETLGYLAPELMKTGKAMTMTDWALECWKRGMLLQVVDGKLKEDYVEEEVYKVVQLVVLCSHTNPTTRLTIWQ